MTSCVVLARQRLLAALLRVTRTAAHPAAGSVQQFLHVMGQVTYSTVAGVATDLSVCGTHV
jgi:hypothetical protein